MIGAGDAARARQGVTRRRRVAAVAGHVDGLAVHRDAARVVQREGDRPGGPIAARQGRRVGQHRRRRVAQGDQGHVRHGGDRRAGRVDRYLLSRRHAAHGQDFDVRVVRQLDTADGLAGVQRETVAVNVVGAGLLAAGRRVAIAGRRRDRFARVILRRGPVADRLHECLRRAVGVRDRERQALLVAVDAGRQEFERLVSPRRQIDALPLRTDDVVVTGRAEIERRPPGQAVVQRLRRESVPVGIESAPARNCRVVVDDPNPIVSQADRCHAGRGVAVDGRVVVIVVRVRRRSTGRCP